MDEQRRCMKTNSLKNFVILTVMAAALFVYRASLGAVTFTNTPGSVSNTYNGTLTLQIGGLTNTETVVIQKFLDANTNNVIDASDLLVQQFNLTDGTNSIIGGVTNFNVPGDLNSTTGAITAALNFKNGDFIQNTIGNICSNCPARLVILRRSPIFLASPFSFCTEIHRQCRQQWNQCA